MQVNLNNTVAFVTCGTNPLGTAICQLLADSGAKVATHCADPEQLQNWNQAMREAGYNFTVHATDITDFAACDTMLSEIENTLGPVDIVVNNTDGGVDATLREMSKVQWDTVLNINLDTVFNITRHVVQGMAERGFGRIINISSIHAQKGCVGHTSYAAASAGMHGFTMALSQEVARKGVTVNTVSPGHIEDETQVELSDDERRQIIAGIPAGRMGRAEEVAWTVGFLASRSAGFITGIDLATNGGQHMV